MRSIVGLVRAFDTHRFANLCVITSTLIALSVQPCVLWNQPQPWLHEKDEIGKWQSRYRFPDRPSATKCIQYEMTSAESRSSCARDRAADALLRPTCADERLAYWFVALCRMPVDLRRTSPSDVSANLSGCPPGALTPQFFPPEKSTQFLPSR